MGLLDRDYDEDTAPEDLRPLYRALAPDPNAEYGTMPWSPYARDKATGERRWALPSSIREGLLGALDLAAGTKTGEVTPRATGALLSVGPAAAAATLPKGATAGIFGGRLAETANLAALERAEAMRKARKSPAQIWKETGWAMGPDKKWRFEISDQDATLNPAMGAGSLPDILNHEKLYTAYPNLLNVKVETGNFGMSRAIAQPQKHTILLNNSVASGDPKLKETLLHEAQHMVQGFENFAPGGSPSERLGKMLPPDWRGSNSGGSLAGTSSPQYEAYFRLMGEVEARNAATRADMSRPDRVYRPPWKTEDVPRKLQIGQTWEEGLGQAAPGLPRSRPLRARLYEAPLFSPWR